MKYHTLKTIIACLFIITSVSMQGQDLIRQQSCEADFLKHQVDSIKNFFGNEGYEVVREASMTMESEYEMPVVAPLKEGTWYQIVFIGDPSSKLQEIRMYDYDEKQVYYKKLYGYTDGNIISYAYVPKFTEYHMIKPVQVNNTKKKKSLCGYIMLLKKVK